MEIVFLPPTGRKERNLKTKCWGMPVHGGGSEQIKLSAQQTGSGEELCEPKGVSRRTLLAQFEHLVSIPI